MSTLDDVNITPVQRGDQSRGLVIPETGGLADAVGGHGRGDDPTGDRGDVLAGSHGGVSAGAPAGTLAPGKHKHARVILDNDEVSSDEGEPLQKRMRQLSGVAGPSGSGPAPAAPSAAATAAAAADQEAADKRAAEEAMVSRAAEKVAADKSTMGEAVVMRAAVRATGDSPAPGMAPSLVVGTKRVATPSGSSPPTK
jgi:hypothetical protein